MIGLGGDLETPENGVFLSRRVGANKGKFVKYLILLNITRVDAQTANPNFFGLKSLKSNDLA
jgi:hypothetical protein